MEIYLIPVKTAQGHEELGSRQRRVGQRHRTMLLLVDGQRTVADVLQLSAKAGVPETCLADLIGLGLVVVPQSGTQRWQPEGGGAPGQPATAVEPAVVAAAPIIQPDPEPEVDLAFPTAEADLSPSELAAFNEPTPSELQEDTEFGMSTVVTDSVLDAGDAGLSPNPLEEARELLLHAVSTEAPVAGALTLMRLKRARTPMELLALIHEVELRINRPHRAMATQQMMGRVAQLLSQAEALHSTSDAY
ncbi:MAG: hypothetical protein V4739_09690 [Pseudomonadota bacterium]